MSLLLLATGLTLLGSPQTLHQGPQDSNFNETLVSGDWFSAALASNRPRLLQEGADAQLFIHSIQVTPRALQLHLHRKVNGTCVPVMTVANKTKRKFQYLMEYGGQKRIFLEEVDPKSYVIFCTHHKEHGKETVVVTLFSKCRRPHPPGHHPHPPDRAGQAPRQGHPARCGSPGKTPGHSQQDPGGTPGTWRPLGSRRALNTR
ncbi:uterocalin isoform X1 [Camelus ferus]|uniref:Uterocalin isoform X1 n=2 Tax=Camelus TaxID=9836 RepID=A0A8B8ST42_CAMFR|nr:uterocalin isoform X1 [Camelus ferus]XP_045373258.1 uterocalin-like isoform X1 [Camelus bactrianus]